MLVLSRKPNQKIRIGNEITVTVVKVRGNVIRLGIEAPRDVRVVRGELNLRIDDSLTAGIMISDEAVVDVDADSAAEEPDPAAGEVSFDRYAAAS